MHCADYTASILWFVKTLEKPFWVTTLPDEANLFVVGTE